MRFRTEAFRALINKANENLGMVSDPAKKAEICATLALAVATTGLVTEVDDKAVEAVKAVKEETKVTGREALQKENKVIEEQASIVEETIPTVEETAPVTEEPVKDRDVTVDDTWDDEYWVNHFAKECEYLQNAVEEYGEEEINEAVKLFSQGNYQTVEDIQPFNIVAFVTYLKELTEEA